MKKIALWSILGFVFFTNTAFADILTQQADTSSSTLTAANTGASGFYQMTTFIGSPSGTWQSFVLQLERLGAGSIVATVIECSSKQYTISAIYGAGCNGVYQGTPTWASNGLYQVFATSSPIVFSANKFYYLDILYGNNGNSVLVYGSASSSVITTVSNIYGRVQYGGVAERQSDFIPYFVFQSENFTTKPVSSSTFAYFDVPTITGGGGITSAYGQWNILQTKFPLNWIFDSYTILYNLQYATATVAFADLSIDFGGLKTLSYIPKFGTTSGQAKVTFWSSSTLASVGSLSGWPALRSLEATFLWVELVFYVWAIKGRFIPKTTA